MQSMLITIYIRDLYITPRFVDDLMVSLFILLFKFIPIISDNNIIIIFDQTNSTLPMFFYKNPCFSNQIKMT